MENYSPNIFASIIMPVKNIFIDYELLQKRRKRYELSNSILEIINKLATEEVLFKNINKAQLYEFLYSNIDVLPYEITEDDLYRRIRQIMAIEAMSKLFDGYPEQLKLFEERLFEERRNFK